VHDFIKRLRFESEEVHLAGYGQYAENLKESAGTIERLMSAMNKIPTWKCVSYCLCSLDSTKGHFERDDMDGTWMLASDVAGKIASLEKELFGAEERLAVTAVQLALAEEKIRALDRHHKGYSSDDGQSGTVVR
jgi:hypothetical protein